MVKHTWYIDISLCWPYRMEDSVLGFVSVPCSASVKLPVNYGNAEYRWMYKRFLRLVFIGQAFKIILGILLKMVNKKFHVAMTLKSSLVAYIYIWTTLRVPSFFFNYFSHSRSSVKKRDVDILQKQRWLIITRGIQENKKTV